MVFVLAILSGLAYWDAPVASSWRSWHLADIGSVLSTRRRRSTDHRSRLRAPPPVLQARASDQALFPPVPRDLGTDRASILIFTPRPGSIATGGSTKLCYAVSGAVQVQVEPGIGDVNATSRLTCLRVAPVRTTTYELTAHGRDGQPVRQQLVIVVP